MSIVVLFFSLFQAPQTPSAQVTAEAQEPMRWYGVEQMLAEFDADARAEADDVVG